MLLCKLFLNKNMETNKLLINNRYLVEEQISHGVFGRRLLKCLDLNEQHKQ